MLEIAVEVRDQCDRPIWDMPAEDIYAVTSNSYGGRVSCLDDTIYATSPTSGSGQTIIEIPRVGGCGDITFDVYADGALIGQPTIWVRSTDLSGDCSVDSNDWLDYLAYVSSQDDCADLNGDGNWDLADDVIMTMHVSGGHFCIDPDYSRGIITPTDYNCLLLCPKGDIESFTDLVIARSALNLGFPYASIPAESIWISIPEPEAGQGDFRFLCRPDPTLAIADDPTWGPEKTTITVNSGGGSCWQAASGQMEDWSFKTCIGGLEVDEWAELAKSPDINASGSVSGSDISIWSGDFGSDHFRSDLDCSGTVGNEDFDVLNHHYKHKCGTSSQMVAEGYTEPASWTVNDATKIRSHLPNYVLDQLLRKDLHPELKALLTHVRSLSEPDSLARLAGESQNATAELLPRTTAMAQSVPNPFRATALINYQIAPPGGQVKILIFDVAGRRVRTLVDEAVPPGFYTVPWDGRNDSGRRVASGVYFYQMKAPGFTSNKRMLLVR